MSFLDLTKFLQQADYRQPVHYSELLRLRPNYLIYYATSPLDQEQRSFLLEKEIPWAEFQESSPIEAVVYFLNKVKGGLYCPLYSESLLQSRADHCFVFLLDPHLIDDFELKISPKRAGVLIRRNIIATDHFAQLISLENL